MQNPLRRIMMTGALGLFALVLICASGAPAAEQLPGAGKSVKPAKGTWTTGFFQAALVNRGMQELGYEVKKTKELSNPIFYQAVAYGEVDYWANGWFPLHDAQVPENFDQKASKVGMIAERAGVQGYLVSKDAADELGITSLDDFKRPEVKEAFDANSDGKADLVACPPGWGCAEVIKHHMDVYDLREHINPVKANYSANFADAVTRYKAGNPVLAYTWAPNWTVFMLKPGKDVYWLNVPEIIPTKSQKPFEEALTATGIEGSVSDPLKMGFVANNIRIVANNEFLSHNPAAQRFFELFDIEVNDIAQQNYLMHQGEDDDSDIQRHVSDWIEENRETWDGWIEEAKAAAR
jgi:glycine betaine/proline transport system substrate-binding protein